MSSWESFEVSSSSSEGEDRNVFFSNLKTRILLRSKDKKDWKNKRVSCRHSIVVPDFNIGRWFSWKREFPAHAEHSDSDGAKSEETPECPDEDHGEGASTAATASSKVFLPKFSLSLPPEPLDLTPEQLKRRYIVASIINSENSYVSTLERLIKVYRNPLLQSRPPVLSATNAKILFHRLPEILQYHSLFRVVLADCVRSWNTCEQLGDVFLSTFSNPGLLDAYSDFINNFSRAMEVAKAEERRKPAFRDFLKMNQLTSSDRLSLFALMVKPVQRFPQFILQLQDLLKYTPPDHADRLPLQSALSQLEDLAEVLNERKRAAERMQACADVLKRIRNKPAAAARAFAAGGRRAMLKEEDVKQLSFSPDGLVTRTKDRRLLLFSDYLICVGTGKSGKKVSLKWGCPLGDVEVQRMAGSAVLGRMGLAVAPAASTVTSHAATATAKKSRSSGCLRTPEGSSTSTPSPGELRQKMSELMQDFETVKRIGSLVASLRSSYEGLSLEVTSSICDAIQQKIREKDEEASWIDACCLQLRLRDREERVIVLQAASPSAKKAWVTELRLAQLALSSSSSPSWDDIGTTAASGWRVPSFRARVPLLSSSRSVYSSRHETSIRCGCICDSSDRDGRLLWLCSSDGVSSHVSVCEVQLAAGLRDVSTFDLFEVQVVDMVFVPGLQDAIWLGTDRRRIFVYSARDPEKPQEIGSVNSLPAAVVQLVHSKETVCASLENGSIAVFRRGDDGSWSLCSYQVLSLGGEEISVLATCSDRLCAASARTVWTIDHGGGALKSRICLEAECAGPRIRLVVFSPVGLWIAAEGSAILRLHDGESFRFLRDFDIGAVLSRRTGFFPVVASSSPPEITSLLATPSHLWIGTSAGLLVTIRMPRLEGVPLGSDYHVRVSRHLFRGPVSLLLLLDAGSSSSSSLSTSSCPRLCPSPTSATPVGPPAKIDPVEPSRKFFTLPAGAGPSRGRGRPRVFDLYGSLMDPRDLRGDERGVPGRRGDGDGGDSGGCLEGTLRRSDPDLGGCGDASSKGDALQRMVRMRCGRSRSMDLSHWSVDSRESFSTSSGSEEATAARPALPLIVASSRTMAAASTDADTTFLVLSGGRGHRYLPPNGCERDISCEKDSCVILWESSY